jgi:hypothetical protein
MAPIPQPGAGDDEIAPQRGVAVALLSGVHARYDAAGVTEKGEALGSADRPQALSKKNRPG